MYEIEMKTGGNTMYCYRGIKYDAKTLKSNAKKSKAKKSDEITYRGITGKIAA
jgi:hypothetical protein|tara:strand:+ start:517 stop:675 length:159 start_codon:yes stop_codon:yes gene_type:complete